MTFSVSICGKATEPVGTAEVIGVHGYRSMELRSPGLNRPSKDECCCNPLEEALIFP